jgi:hypothetical protein
MGFAKRNLTLFAPAVILLMAAGMHFFCAAGTTPADQSASIGNGETTDVKISRAISAMPANVASGARIVDIDAQGKMEVLGEVNNGFACMPGNRSDNDRTADHAQGNRCLHHVGGFALCPDAHQGAPLNGE